MSGVRDVQPPGWLTIRQSARLQPLLPTKPRGVPRVDDRRVIGGVFRLIRTGFKGRDASGRYGWRRTAYIRAFSVQSRSVIVRKRVQDQHPADLETA
ncbi:MAG: hypothetical protein AAF281_08110, partial [Pseudomonadota bacterium]